MRVVSGVCGAIVVFIDEFDKLEDPGTSGMFAATIKALSDNAEPVTLVPVGVADSVDQLIGAHQSIRRSMVQVPMPRMSRQEIAGVAVRGFDELDMTADRDSMEFISTVPRGLPHYAHLLAQEGARQALIDRRSDIVGTHLIEGLRVGLGKVDHTLNYSYEEATYSPVPSKYADVLLACALVEPDQHGYFSPSQVVEPFARVTGRAAKIPDFNDHLAQMCSARGEILARTGGERRRRYRFSDPLMEPYVLLRGLDDGRVSFDEVIGKPAPEEPPGDEPQLFQP
jgi:hypothetical protein